MKYYAFLLATLFVSSGLMLHAQTPNFLWAESAGDTSNEGGNCIVVDASGNSYVTGTFYGPSIKFASITLTSMGGGDTYIVKYNSNGDVVWAKSAGGTNEDASIGIALDPQGYIYVTGNFKSGSITFGTTTLTNTNSGYSDIFIVKYNLDGDIVWGKSIGGDRTDVCWGIAIDALSNVLVTGMFTSPSITFGSTVLLNSHSGFDEMYVAKLDSGGTISWAKNAIGYAEDYGVQITVDLSGNSYVIGNFYSDSITFGPYKLFKGGGAFTDMFIVKYNSIGNTVWAKKIGGTTFNFWEFAGGIASDGEGNIIFSGSSTSNILLFGSNLIWNKGESWSKSDVFIIKCDTNKSFISRGNLGNWDYYQTNNRGLAIDANRNIYVTGDLGYYNNSTIYIAKFNPTGTFVWRKYANGSGYGAGISVDAFGNIYTTGGFNSSTISFDADTLRNAGKNDMFIAKLAMSPNEVKYHNSEVPDHYSLGQNYPNPFNPITTISYQIYRQSHVTLNVSDVLGREVAMLVGLYRS